VLTTLLLAAVLTLPMSATAQPPSPDADEVARALQQRYDGIRDFTADFEHRYQGGVLRKQAIERGTVLIRKPGLMRWTYTWPERKVFVSDGTRLYAYIPEDRQVTITPVPATDRATTPILFLAGKGHLTRDFTASFAPTPNPAPGTHTLRLIPRRPEAEYDAITLVLDRASLQIRMLVTTDAQGGESTFVFTNLRENTGIPDKEFRFTIPRGVDVITNGQLPR
jgi:outer membrane lipoprotein carrier protein